MKNLKIDQLTFTRFIAAFSIVVLHFGLRAFPFNNHNISFFFKQASVAVSYFFMLSGYVMIIAYNDKPQIYSVQYLKNRLARIYPVYLIAILILIFSFLLSKKISMEDMLLNIFLAQAWLPNKALSFNPAGWSLSVEIFFYLIFPILFNKIYKKFSFSLIAWLIIFFWLFSQVVFHYISYFNWPVNGSYMEFFPLMHLNEFLVGNLVALFYLKKNDLKPRNFDVHILILVLVLIAVLKHPIGLNYHNGMLALIFSPLVILISLNNGWITTIFKKKFFTFLGEISYGIYILQFPVYALFTDFRLHKYLNIDRVSNLNFYIKLVVLLLLSSLSYVFIEKPIRSWMRKNNLKDLNSNGRIDSELK